MEIDLPIPLTLEERLSVARLFGHDVLEYFNELKCELGEKTEREGNSSYERATSIIYHAEDIGKLILFLTQGSEITLSDHDTWSLRSSSERELFFKELKRLFPGNLPILKTGFRNSSPGKLEISQYDVPVTRQRDFQKDGFPNEFLSNRFLLHAILFNLIKNGIEAQNNDKENAMVNIDIRYQEKFPEQALYVPAGARDYNRFMAFHVSDNGREFLTTQPITDYFKRTSPPKGGRGFGTYFIGLAARILKAPIAVETKPGDTTVSFYHPVYS